jgi:pyridoxine 5-phosphate synthase
MNKKNNIRLGVNIDHVATLRNVRGNKHPDVLLAAEVAVKAGADLITIHLREDRRHIKDDDVFTLIKHIKVPINLEMAATDEMIEIAKKAKPAFCCIVPEKRMELTTEGGLNLKDNFKNIQSVTKELKKSNIKVSLFIDADKQSVTLAKESGADNIEIHTGKYARLFIEKNKAYLQEFEKIKQASILAQSLGLNVHAGHGLDYASSKYLIKIKQIQELNIGHFLISQAIFLGLEKAIKKMKKAIN